MRNKLMTRLMVAGLLAISLAACDVIQGRETAGEYIDDAAISTKIRTAIIQDNQVKLSQVDVNTLQGVVQLSGFADSTAGKARAAEIARSTSGVKSVNNDIIVKAP